jgi:hypothetical protein
MIDSNVLVDFIRRKISNSISNVPMTYSATAFALALIMSPVPFIEVPSEDMAFPQPDDPVKLSDVA